MPGLPKKLALPPISAAEPSTLYQQIVDGLKREVSEGRLPAGTPLPSFRILAAELMVSVITVKRAYEELEREGIIYRRQGLGTFVSSTAVDRSREAKNVRARELLREALREATEAGLSAKDVVHLLQAIIHEEREPRHVRKRD
jgi:GntR family transcriptional regulator